MAKSSLPMIAIAGAAALAILMPKKKKTSTSSKTTDVPSDQAGDPNIVMTGMSQGWEWQVAKSQRPGFGAEYFGYARPNADAAWAKASTKGVPNPSTAKAIALEYIINATTPVEA